MDIPSNATLARSGWSAPAVSPVRSTVGSTGSTRHGRRWLLARGLLVFIGGLPACGVTDEEALPPGIDDPANIQTPAGALARYQGTLDSVPLTVGLVVREGQAIITDELVAVLVPSGQGLFTTRDRREGLADRTSEQLYNDLHKLRAQAREARGVLATYAPDSPAALRGHLYAVEGYAEVFLADIFCSGIPLSTVDFGGDYTLATGSTTAEVYHHAVALFDSALALTADSLRLRDLAALGKGRALLALDSASAASAAVAPVLEDYRYQVTVVAPHYSWFWSGADPVLRLNMGDHEGQNGLDYRSSGDPRTPAHAVGSGYVPDTLTYPIQDGAAATFTLATGVEARLIDAEAVLRAGDVAGWRTRLNALRTDGTFDTQPTADPNDDPAALDTLWHAGTGGVPGLAPLADPGGDDARVDLLFRERAFWLYLTAHRLGDLRRLVRQYGRPPDAVFPTGPYPDGISEYGEEIVIPVPESERTYNPKYAGCIHLNA